MIQKDFWRNSKVAVIGGGAFGTVLANIAAKNAMDVRIWVRAEEQARAINVTRAGEYLPEMPLDPKIHASTDLSKVFETGVQIVVWALPSEVCRSMAARLAPAFTGEEIILHATKGIEQGSLKRISEILREELPVPRIGVISGPNLAAEIAKGEPAAAVVASRYREVIEAGQAVLTGERFRVYGVDDVVGVEWAGTLKNVLAIASGALDAMQFGWNARAMLITRGLAEMVRFGVAMGAKESTFLGLAGIGDLMATCASPLSRNYRVGARLAKGETLEQIMETLGSTAEGVRTTETVWKYAQLHKIYMPITEAVYHVVKEKLPVRDALAGLMNKPSMPEMGT
jgi:glycerol-3-phosphate dehydrogenase (NAD(P)+)